MGGYEAVFLGSLRAPIFFSAVLGSVLAGYYV